MANKKLFEDLILGTPSNTDRIAFGKAGAAYKNITYSDFKAMILSSVPAPYTPEFLTKVVNITSYDMAGGERNKDVDLGIARSRIRSCTVLIRSNTGGLYPLAMQGNNKEIKSYWWIRQESTYSSNARVSIRSESGSFFNQSSFDGTSYTRGYIYITYTP